MTDYHFTEDYIDCVSPLLENAQVQSMRRWPHHLTVSCYDHSVNVSMMAYRIAVHMGCDGRAAARAGLLHDFYLYAAKDFGYTPFQQAIAHPKAALKNAQALCPDLSEIEADAIANHMWPVSAHRPHSRVALAVNLADKTCCVMEVAGVYHDRLKAFFVPDRITPDLP